MINQNLPQILALAPKGLDGIGVVVAACRASALGIVDLCSVNESDSAQALRQISRLTSGYFGVRVEAAEFLVSPWLCEKIDLLGVVCIAPGADDEPSLETAVQAIQRAAG